MEKSSPNSSKSSLAVLVAVNLFPIAGVLLWDWSVFEIVSLYWFENVVIGAVNVLKMISAAGNSADISAGGDSGFPGEAPEIPAHLRTPEFARALNRGAKLILIPFFTIHYGMFCLIHGVFVFALLGGKNGGMMSGGPFLGIGTMISRISDSGGKWFVLAIIGSHLFSFFVNYIGKGEYRRITPHGLMAAPYGRIVVLHIAILFGASVITALGSPVFLLILLILGKIALDMKLHLRSREKMSDGGGRIGEEPA